MHTTTTYAKRHRLQHRREDSIGRPSYDVDLNLDSTESKQRELSSSKSQKRKRPDEPGIEPHRKKKSSEIVDVCASTLSFLYQSDNVIQKTTNKMALYPFQTPFPTLQTQSQAFRLPSSSPKHSPGLLSPVPVVLHKPIPEHKNPKQNIISRNTKSWFHSRSRDL